MLHSDFLVKSSYQGESSLFFPARCWKEAGFGYNFIGESIFPPPMRKTGTDNRFSPQIIESAAVSEKTCFEQQRKSGVILDHATLKKG